MPSTIVVREYCEQDIFIQDEYFDKATDEYLYNLGVDPSKIRNQPTDLEKVRANLKAPIQQRLAQNYAIDLDGKIIGIAVIKKIKFGDSAHLHAHIFKLENRHQGIASQVFMEVLRKAFTTFELKVLICEPTTTNIPPNAFLQKMGLKIIETFQSPAEGILRARTANRYEILRDFLLNKLP